MPEAIPGLFGASLVAETKLMIAVPAVAVGEFNVIVSTEVNAIPEPDAVALLLIVTSVVLAAFTAVILDPPGMPVPVRVIPTKRPTVLVIDTNLLPLTVVPVSVTPVSGTVRVRLSVSIAEIVGAALMITEPGVPTVTELMIAPAGIPVPTAGTEARAGLKIVVINMPGASPMVVSIVSVRLAVTGFELIPPVV
jgi:hypothetical protein